MIIKKKFKQVLSSVLILFFANTACADMQDPNKNNEEYISIGEMAEGFSEYNLPQTQDLAGKTYTLYFGEGKDSFGVKHTFVDSKVVRWEVLSGPDKGMVGYDEYIGTNPKEGYYFVEFITGSNKAKFVSFVLDLKRNIATAVFGHFPTAKRRQSINLSACCKW